MEENFYPLSFEERGVGWGWKKSKRSFICSFTPPTRGGGVSQEERLARRGNLTKFILLKDIERSE